MIDFIFGFLVGGALLFQLGFYLNRLFELVGKLAPTNEPEPAVTYGSYRTVNENASTRDDSVIVEPKTPQQVAWEAEQELDKRNA